jgi:hypothetical protein
LSAFASAVSAGVVADLSCATADLAAVAAAACKCLVSGVMNVGACGSTFADGKKPVIDAMLAMLKEMVKAATTAIKKRSGVAEGTIFKDDSRCLALGDFSERKYFRDIGQPEIAISLYQS